MADFLHEGELTLVDLLHYTHSQLMEWLTHEAGKLGGREVVGSSSLQYCRRAIQVLSEAAESHRDAILYDWLDDVTYVINETLMGARAKGESVLLTDVEPKLKAFEERQA